MPGPEASGLLQRSDDDRHRLAAHAEQMSQDLMCHSQLLATSSVLAR